jgi:ferredoxin
MHVSVERSRCIAGGHCVLQAPDVFDQDDQDGQVVLLNADPGPEQQEAVRAAAELCPAAAIILSE